MLVIKAPHLIVTMTTPPPLPPPTPSTMCKKRKYAEKKNLRHVQKNEKRNTGEIIIMWTFKSDANADDDGERL